ncbi:YHS domain-containing (seleno)protein [Brevundimonas sp.]|jgi:YHS domain-containing protein|uniref:YHS domain-containing (seleno)protein n=1 Tax=Brevundimonas sp. TaxID=1871086 RepID=UPI002E0DC75D|nr:YHS domain-containing (seleno)protein [Brevundimonas sp.]
MIRLALAAALALAVPAAPVMAQSTAAHASVSHPAVHQSDDGLAIGGYDPVAYFDEGRPVVGSAAHQLEWNGATWRFASAAHLAVFRADPAAYAPQFGGYCAWAASQGYIAPGDPQVWRIVDGRLYLNFNARAQALWEDDVPGAIARGQANWPRILTDNQG